VSTSIQQFAQEKDKTGRKRNCLVNPWFSWRTW